jgi:alkanesulfonate monooxygenase
MPIEWYTLLDISREDSLFTADQIIQIRSFINQTNDSGFNGILIPESNQGMLHPFFFAQEVCTQTAGLTPFIALNPLYAHPFYTAKYLLNLSLLYQRRISLNLITGTNNKDQQQLGINLDHNSRYERLYEYTHIFYALLRGEKVDFAGNFYNVSNLQLSASLPAELLPGLYIAGNSTEALALAPRLNTATLQMAKPLAALSAADVFIPTGFHLGILAREQKEAATEAMEKISPPLRERAIMQKISFINTDAVWKKELYQAAVNEASTDGVYTLVPFKYYHSDVPYLVGSYDEVAAYIREYIQSGLTAFVVEIAGNTGSNEFLHIQEVFKRLR